MLRSITTQVRKLNLDDSDRIEQRKEQEQRDLKDQAELADKHYLEDNKEEFFNVCSGEIAEELKSYPLEDYGKVIDRLFREYCNYLAKP